jgi:hypothetical protein
MRVCVEFVCGYVLNGVSGVCGFTATFCQARGQTKQGQAQQRQRQQKQQQQRQQQLLQQQWMQPLGTDHLQTCQ